MSTQIGFIAPFAGTVVPSGWIPCNGQSLLRASYPDLFDTIGEIYGATDTDHFNVPNLINRVVVGAGDDYALADIGGSADKTLSSGNLPSHTHTVSVKGNGISSNSNDPNGNYFGGGTYTTYDTNWDDESIMNGGTATASNTGSGESFSIMNPFMALTWCIAAETPN